MRFDEIVVLVLIFASNAFLIKKATKQKIPPEDGFSVSACWGDFPKPH
jgi:hypothetical protein